MVLGGLPPEIGQVSELRVLNLGNCQLGQLPAQLAELQALEELDLEYAQATKLPESFGALANLRSLNLFRVPLVELPASFGNLSAHPAAGASQFLKSDVDAEQSRRPSGRRGSKEGSRAP